MCQKYENWLRVDNVIAVKNKVIFSPPCTFMPGVGDFYLFSGVFSTESSRLANNKTAFGWVLFLWHFFQDSMVLGYLYDDDEIHV